MIFQSRLEDLNPKVSKYITKAQNLFLLITELERKLKMLIEIKESDHMWIECFNGDFFKGKGVNLNTRTRKDYSIEELDYNSRAEQIHRDIINYCIEFHEKEIDHFINQYNNLLK